MKESLRNWWHHFKLKFRKPKYDSKVFCIGYNKTGTTTIGKAFEMLGYYNSSFDNKVWRNYKQGNINKVIEYTAKFDTCDDLPWLNPDMIKLIYEKFPDSKFIYTERDEMSWKRSYTEWRTKFKTTIADADRAWHNYLEHQAFVLDFFKDKQEQLLKVNVNEKGGFRRMAEFLGKESPDENFPHFNKTNSN
jgi:hypothetical protein